MGKTGTSNDTEKQGDPVKYESPEGSKTWEYMATFACSTLMFCIGSSLGWNSPSSVKLSSEESPIRLNSSDVSTLMSLVALGQMLAPPINSLIVDRIGRKNTILLSGLPLIISWSMVTIAENVTIMYLARLAAGLSHGVGYCVCYMYVGEIASNSGRGVANVLMIVMLNLGMLMAFAIGPPLSVQENAWVNLLLVIVFVGVFYFMPESPYFLMMKDELEEAEVVLQKIRGKTDVSEELDLIEKSLRSIRKLQESQQLEFISISGPNSSSSSSYIGLKQLKPIFSNKASRKAILIIGLFSFTHHFGGYSAVMTYGQKIFKDLRVQGYMSDHAANVINGIVQLVSVSLTTLCVDKWGRKPLIAFSGFISGLCCLIVGVYFYLQEYVIPLVSITGLAANATNANNSIADYHHHQLLNYSFLPMIAVFFVVFAFNCGLIIVQGILISEVFAPEFKALGVCIVIMNGGLMNTIATKFYFTIADTWHYGHSPPFLFFVIVLWSVTALLMYITPETKGKTLLNIQKALLE